MLDTLTAFPLACFYLLRGGNPSDAPRPCGSLGYTGREA